MFAFQLIDGRLLQVAVDGETHIRVRVLRNSLAFGDTDRFWHRPALNSKERALKTRIAAIRSKDVGQRFIHRILPIDVTAAIAPIERKCAIKSATAIVNPTAEC